VSCSVLGLDLPSAKELPAIPFEDARRYLASLVSGYRQGQRQPLPFAPAASTALAGALAEGKDEQSALGQANASWAREPFREILGGEGTSTTSTLAWRDADAFTSPHDEGWIHWAREVAAPASTWWSGQLGDATPQPASAQPSPKQA
jgi:exonuclease V gamma subunit